MSSQRTTEARVTETYVSVSSDGGFAPTQLPTAPLMSLDLKFETLKATVI